jgi:hypothetical protein
MECQHYRQKTISALNLCLMPVRQFGIVPAPAQMAIARIGKMDRTRRKPRRVVRADQPRGHVCSTGTEMCHSRIDMIPAEFRFPAFAKSDLDIGIEFAQIMKRRGVHDRACDRGPRGPVRVI